MYLLNTIEPALRFPRSARPDAVATTPDETLRDERSSWAVVLAAVRPGAAPAPRPADREPEPSPALPVATVACGALARG
ncbi:hypothetical protein GC722_03245 [Auraticoccus sp. F435]|uniref:Uncharacterized protein n=1 Tax=Auraticoccus cholistanensis TaxID=2656650 RepID=A0A6A9UR40_9ACTN|nr:hypothetical protein [Auraticoccus cholistanensis]MVA75048.1 hypothetical protein [Auraticoccus cholistanensis]